MFVSGTTAPQWTRVSFTMFLDQTQRRTTFGGTPLEKWSARRRDLYLTKHNTHNKQTFMPPVRFEPAIAASERPQTDALDRAATGTGRHLYLSLHEIKLLCLSLISRHRCFSRRWIWNIQAGRSFICHLSLYRLRNVTHDVIMATSRTLTVSFPALLNECRTQALQGLEFYVDCGNYYVIFM
jgi:hypothetical protein